MTGYYVARYHARKAAGLCVDCGLERGASRARCPKCRKASRKKQRAWRAKYRPAKTEREMEQIWAERSRRMLEAKFGRVLDRALSGGTVTRRALLSALMVVEWQGYGRGYMAGSRERQRRALVRESAA